MASVQQAVLDFDEAVQAPWRPSLRSVTGDRPMEAARPVRAERSVRPGERVGRSPSPLAPPARPASSAPSGRPSVTGRPVRGGCATPSRPSAAPLRLTRRARRLLVVLGLAAAVGLGSWVGPLVTGGAGDDLRLAGVSTVVVEPGDTLWSIAAAVADEGDDVRAVVYEIQQLNRLEGAGVVPGQVLQLP
ncbi:LysM peptidoglycan-binding domain-containing protein [Geodermatophilus sp. URMC 64]